MRARVIVVAVVAGRLGPGASAGAQTPSSFAPAGWDAELTLHELPDRNPDPRVLEIDLTARVADVEIAPSCGSRPGPTTAACRGR
jgi:hypothetical protein